MPNSETEFLSLFGWDGFFESQMTHFLSQNLVPARVICEERNLYRVQLDIEKVAWASISGKMQFNARTRADYPAVGDWVLLESEGNSDRAIIHSICPRKTVIQRKQVGSNTDIQILSSNVDYVFVTTSANDDLNYRRVERYLAVAWESGSTPIILLTKADVCAEKISEITTNVRMEFPGVEVFSLSQDEFEKAEFFPDYLKTGKTSVVIGSSGVGKSTLVNFLIGDEQIKTQDVRKADGKGRHTTTSRSLYVSRYGGLIIDTPGMRELQLSDHADGVKTQFADIETLIEGCRFTDCQHRTEPGCKIIEALEDNSLSETRWISYQKLIAEVRHSLRKQNRALASEDRKLWRKRSLDARTTGLTKRGRWR